jgi:hypothetical protein
MFFRERQKRIVEDYLNFLRLKPCLFCDRPDASPHHLVSRKWREPTRDDFLCVPACRRCHTEIHSLGLVRVLCRHGMEMRHVIAAVADLLVEYFGKRELRGAAPF